jgi:hypothetical protein
MALNPSGAISLAGPSAGQSIAVELGQSATATISLNDTNVRTLAGVASGVIVMPTDFWGKSSITNTQKAIFGFGRGAAPTNLYLATTNLVSSSGVVASDTPGVGTARSNLAAASYGGDKAIFGFGLSPSIPGSKTNITNLVSNTGVVASNTPGVGTARETLAATGYGGDKAIFGLGDSAPTPQFINYVSNTGVLGSDFAISGTIISGGAGVVYGGDKGMFAYGIQTSPAFAFTNSINYVSNTGVFAAAVPGVGTARSNITASTYGGDKAIFSFALNPTYVTNLVSNTGVVASNTPGVGTIRQNMGGAGYGGDKGIFGFGANPAFSPAAARTLSMTNLISNTGIVAADTPGIGTRRYSLSAAGYSTTA